MKTPFSSPDLPARIAGLKDLKRVDLAALWAETFGHPVTIPPRQEFHARCLAYALQARAYGGLPPAARKRLLRAAEALERGEKPSLAQQPRMKPGTRLIREWRGETHEVTATDKGFDYRGRRFASLSEIARRITGTRWSGPAFFGLKGASKPAGCAARGR